MNKIITLLIRLYNVAYLYYVLVATLIDSLYIIYYYYLCVVVVVV
jgi:hypothetical protein